MTTIVLVFVMVAFVGYGIALLGLVFSLGEINRKLDEMLKKDK